MKEYSCIINQKSRSSFNVFFSEACLLHLELYEDFVDLNLSF